MGLTSLVYTPPLRRDAVGQTLDYSVLEHAVEQYANGDAMEATRSVFRHLFPDAAPDLAQPFSFTQGSSRVTVRIDDGVCFVTVPMVKLPASGGAVAALRYVLQSINSSGQLFQGRVRGDDLALEFADKLHALHPHKLIEVLRRMPVEADRHDDWMERQFQATPLDRAPMEPLAGADLERAFEIWRVHWDEVDELTKEALRKRNVWFLNEVTGYALHRLRFALPVCGSVLPRLLEAAGTFNDADIDPRKREATLGKVIKEMKAITPEELTKSLGHVQHAITPHQDGTPERLTGLIGPCNYRSTIEKYLSSGYSLEAALAMVGTYYYLLATHAWPEPIAAALKEGLEASSGKPWRETAGIMLAHAESVCELVGSLSSDDDEEEEEDEDDESDDDDSDEEASDE
jgi:hypothetical protein